MNVYRSAATSDAQRRWDYSTCRGQSEKREYGFKFLSCIETCSDVFGKKNYLLVIFVESVVMF